MFRSGKEFHDMALATPGYHRTHSDYRITSSLSVFNEALHYHMLTERGELAGLLPFPNANMLDYININ